MLRLLALSLLALAAPQAAAEQVHPCQAETPPCSVETELALRDLEEANRDLEEARRELAQALRDGQETLRASRRQHEWIREAGPGVWETPAERYERTHKPRYHVPYPLSRELLTGTVNPCAGSRPACPRELENIYDGLEIWGDDKDSWHYQYHLFRLEKYYRNHQP